MRGVHVLRMIDVFDAGYSASVWGYGSGGGSDPNNAAQYVAFLSGLVYSLHPPRVLDIGCGDGRMAAAVNWCGADYCGVDVSSGALALFQEQFDSVRAKSVTLICGDALTVDLPPADLVICKEVMQHMDTESTHRLIERLRCIGPVVVCNGITGTGLVGEINGPVSHGPGTARGIDLSLPPYSLPVETVFEYTITSTRYIVQTLGL